MSKTNLILSQTIFLTTLSLLMFHLFINPRFSQALYWKPHDFSLAVFIPVLATTLLNDSCRTMVPSYSFISIEGEKKSSNKSSVLLIIRYTIKCFAYLGETLDESQDTVFFSNNFLKYFERMNYLRGFRSICFCNKTRDKRKIKYEFNLRQNWQIECLFEGYIFKVLSLILLRGLVFGVKIFCN
jgi:hypothetical protein